MMSVEQAAHESASGESSAPGLEDLIPIAVVIGAGCGSLLFLWLGPELRGYAVLFLISSSLRIAGLLYLRRSIDS